MRILQGDILSFQGDTIVNPANLFLRHGAGLAAVIASAAVGPPTTDQNIVMHGQRFKSECSRQPTLATGDACWTTAGNLPFKGIVHAVGPVWSGGNLYERPLLKAAHQNACAVAYDRRCQSIAFPAISCGLFRFPVTEAAKVAVAAVSGFWGSPQPEGVGMDVSFYLFEDAHYEAYIDAAIVAGIAFDTTPLSR